METNEETMQMNITWLKIPTDRRQTSWLASFVDGFARATNDESLLAG